MQSYNTDGLENIFCVSDQFALFLLELPKLRRVNESVNTLRN